MKTEEKIICDYIANFVNENWDKINKRKCEITKSKEEFIEEVKSEIGTAMWVLDDVANWGMDKKYLCELFCDLHDEAEFRVIKIGDKYIKCTYIYPDYVWEINFTQPKTKTVYYFE